MIAAGHRARSLRVLSWQDSPHEYRIRLEEVCECVCLQVMCVFFMCLRLYGPIWVRSMSDEGHREQMACWRCMNTLTHLSLSLCASFSQDFFLFLQCHTTLSPTAHAHTHTHTEFNIYVLSLIQPCDMHMRMQCVFGYKCSILFECRCIVRALLDRISIIVIHFTRFFTDMSCCRSHSRATI